MNWMLLPLRRYAQFTGRSQRKEFWLFMLLQVLLFSAVTLVGVFLSLPALRSGIGPADPVAMMLALRPMLIPFGLLFLALLLPTLAVSVRRLHDIDRTGWWVLVGYLPSLLRWAVLLSGIALTPILSLVISVAGIAISITLLVFYCRDGTRGPNRYGDDPKGHDLAVTFA